MVRIDRWRIVAGLALVFLSALMYYIQSVTNPFDPKARAEVLG